jgi:glutamine---fructose-6-phosphate transaminase (isomerizing)
MCGIIGYIGSKRPCAPVLIEGLKRLEYRGYDSAGIATVGKNRNIFVEKKSGYVSNVENALPQDMPNATAGIAHTRWATHGLPNDMNAHPHLSHDGRIALVHNGIVENADILRKKLEEEGVIFKSETDTEVLPNLVNKFYEGDLTEATRRALKLVTGTYGIAVICDEDPNTLVVARNGSPIVLGVGEDEHFIASDPSAIVAHTKQIVFLDDGEIATITPSSYAMTNLDAQKIEKEADSIEWELEEMERGDYEHFMLKEITEQPQTIRQGLQGRSNPKKGKVKLGGIKLSADELNAVEEIQFIACGTSYYSSLAASHIIEAVTRVPCRVNIASELRYANPIVNKKAIYFAVSQSGETADTLAATREIKRKGGRVFGIINAVGSTIARETDAGIYVRAGLEVSVASTKAYTSQLLALTLFAVQLGRSKDLSLEEAREILQALDKIPDQIETIVKSQKNIEELANTVKDAPYALFLGRAANHATALEGALKFKELAYIPCEGIAAAEMKHGPLALIEDSVPTIFISPQDNLYEKTLSSMEEVRARGGRIIAIVNEGGDRIKEIADTIIEIPTTHKNLTPFLTVIPMQLLSYYTAKKLGHNIDKPRNLAKSVTVE